MKCDVGRCVDHAAVLITFAHHVRPVPYCRPHAYRMGVLRWDPWKIVSVEPAR